MDKKNPGIRASAGASGYRAETRTQYGLRRVTVTGSRRAIACSALSVSSKGNNPEIRNLAAGASQEISPRR